ncbi:hypothetical protein FNV43_RR14750 [Rhamnella rubrinervis]|uniref:Cathepsin propeptide inhibitor domain-containing protein n=1 Tax=Rhamnella rubrinervis TaxID=2594499 RepID=A0A8K0MGL9_9ROSA|nr:hypothetical protein FNV43_RR14750 [Rhamnella rubrinervis]
MATLFRSLYPRSSRLAFGPSRTLPLPGFSNYSSAFAVQPCVTFTVPNRSPTHHYPDVDAHIVRKATLRNVLASSSKEDLKDLMKDFLTSKLKLPMDDAFEIWCKLYDKSYTSHQEKLYRLKVFEENIEIVLDLNKTKNDKYNKGTNTLTLYNDYCDLADRTEAEVFKFYGIPGMLDEIEEVMEEKQSEAYPTKDL